MNIERLEKLADIVRSGIWVQPNGEVVAFCMTAFYDPHPNSVPFREDIPDRDIISTCACLVGYAVLLFADQRFIDETKPGITYGINWDIEAQQLLDLTPEQGDALFYGIMSEAVTGQDAYRVIRKLLLTEQVDWDMIRADHMYTI